MAFLCTDCKLYQQCKTNKIIGRGDTFSKIMLVLDFPDRDDDYSGKILSGDAGKKVDYILSKVGLKRKDVYITYAIRCKPKDDGEVKKKSVEACRKYLAAEVIQVKPKMIIAMGKFAMWALTDQEALKEFRGHFLKFELDLGGKILSIPVMPTFSPHKSMVKWEYHDYMIHDFKKALMYLKNGGHQLTPVPEHLAVRTLSDLKIFYETMMEETKWATTDLETTGFKFFKHEIINAGYCTNNDKIFVVPLLKYQDPKLFHKWSKEDIDEAKRINSFLNAHEEKVRKVVARVNANKKIKWFLHNGKFDLNFARYHGMPYHDIFFDSLLADSIVDENKMHSLNIAAEYRGYDFGAYDTELWPYTNKDEKKKKSYQHVPVRLLEKYLAIDTYAAKLIAIDQIKELKRDGLFDHFMQVKMPALRLVIETEFVGTKFNRKKIVETNEILTEKVNELVKRAKEITGNPDFNPGSDMQILNYMYAKKFPFKKLNIRETKRGHSVDSETLKKFAKIEKFAELPKVILTYKALTKLAGTYVAGKIGGSEVGGFLQHLDNNDRVHTSFNMWTPRTGRYSSNGPSLQVFPRPIKGLPNIRSFIEPENEDWILFEADYSALEMNVVAAESKDVTLIKELQDDVDIHSQNAVDLGRTLKTIQDDITYNHVLVAVDKHHGIIPEEEVAKIRAFIQEHYPNTNFKESRNFAKTLGFGLNYGKAAYTFAKDFGITEEEAQSMIDAYFKKYYGMKKWRDNYVSTAFKRGYATLSSGRRRRIEQARDWIMSPQGAGTWNAKKIKGEIERQLMNYPVQGGAHEVFEPAILRLSNKFKEEGLEARLLLLIHDGIVGECKRHEAKRVIELLQQEMPVTFHKGTDLEVTLKVDTDLYKWEWYGEKIKH